MNWEDLFKAVNLEGNDSKENSPTLTIKEDINPN